MTPSAGLSRFTRPDFGVEIAHDDVVVGTAVGDEAVDVLIYFFSSAWLVAVDR